jgi:hypothetical protein
MNHQRPSDRSRNRTLGLLGLLASMIIPSISLVPSRRSLRGRWAVVLAVVLACIALVAPTLTPAASAASPGITFVFDYSENTPGVGFLDPVTGPARRAAVEAAATLYHDLFAAHFSNSATLNIRILSSIDPADGVAYAYSEVVQTPGTFGNGEVIRTKLITGVDQNGTQYDGTVFFDFQPDLHWELDPNASVDDGEVSFYNAMLHEFTHAIGFASMTVGEPRDVFGQGGPGSGSPGTWNKWDQFLTDGTNDVVNHGSFEANQMAFNNTEPFGGYFVGPNAVAANGGPVHLSTQRSHLDDNLFPTALMKSGGVDVGIPGVVNTRVWNNVEVGILTDLGYTPVAPTAGFPSTSVLDTFNRANGKVGSNWEGLTGTDFYKIASNKLDVQLGGPIVWKPSSFGTSQEAFVTLSTIDSKSPSQGLLLKVQTGSVPDTGAITVVYDAKAKAVRVSALRLGAKGAWTLYANQAVIFANNDVLGARARANGKVEIYKNGTLITTVTLNTKDQAFFNAKGGKIGIWSIAASNALFDNFGGGNVTGS